MKIEKIGFCLLFLTLCSLPTIVLADPVKDQLDKLEKTIQGIQNDSVQRNEKVASALATMEQIKQEYQMVQGTMEANSHLIQTQQTELARLKRDMEDRLASIEERLEIYDQQITKAVAKVLPQAASEMEAYQKALALVQRSDFLTAVSSFRNFIKTYPKSELVDNAQYWIGECYFTLKDYPKAIKEFQIVVEKYPKSEKTISATLKQGFSFAEMGMPEEAKPFLNKVIKEHPGSDESVRAKEKLDKLDQKANAIQTPITPGVGALPPPTDSNSNVPLAPGVKQQLPATTEKPATTSIPTEKDKVK